MFARDRRLLLCATAATSALLLAAAVGGHPELMGYAAPLFLLAVPLAAGHYVGEQRLLRRTARKPRRPRAASTALPRARHRVALLPRGGRLIAEALAVRPPPIGSLS